MTALLRPHRTYPESPRRRPLVGAALALASVLVVTGCGAASDGAANPDSPAAGTATAMGHVHGLGVDPADDTLYIASHLGVFQVPEGGTPTRVADRYQDTMGFAVLGPGQFLGSGHPDLREDLPTSLGLIESSDAARTWQSVSLQGEADLHSIEAVDGRIYAFDSSSGELVVSDDTSTWDTISRQPIYDLAVNPADPGTVYATTDRGVLVASTDGAEPVPVSGAPVLTGIDWQPDGPLVGVAVDGTVMLSDDTRTWRESGRLDGPAGALDAGAGRWHAATGSGVYESRDDGETWQLVVALAG